MTDKLDGFVFHRKGEISRNLFGLDVRKYAPRQGDVGVGWVRQGWSLFLRIAFPGGRKRGSPLSRFTRGPGKPDQETRKRVCAYTHPQRRRPDREIFQVSRDRRSCSDAKCQRREVSRSRHLVSIPFRVKAFFPSPAFPGPAAAPQVLYFPSSPNRGKSYARRGRIPARVRRRGRPRESGSWRLDRNAVQIATVLAQVYAETETGFSPRQINGRLRFSSSCRDGRAWRGKSVGSGNGEGTSQNAAKPAGRTLPSAAMSGYGA